MVEIFSAGALYDVILPVVLEVPVRTWMLPLTNQSELNEGAVRPWPTTRNVTVWVVCSSSRIGMNGVMSTQYVGWSYAP